MDFDLNFAMDVMYPAASAAYLIMNSPQPPLNLPAGYQLVGPILADPQGAAHRMAQATPDQQRIPSAMVAESSIFGLVAWNATTSTALVAIRGTKTVWEWIGDFEAAPVPWFVTPADGDAHMGFQLTYEHLCSSLRGLLRQGCAGVKKVLVTGHSLGGALAAMAAFDIFANLGLGVTPEVYTFAGPRVVSPGFAALVTGALPTFWRVVNFMDVVPQVPTPPVYKHAGQEVLVHGGFKPLDVTYAHHLTTYLAGMQALAAQPASPGPVPAAAAAPQTLLPATP